MSRRSSLLLGQQALTDGIIKDPREISDIIRQLPLSVTDSARHSTGRRFSRGSRSTATVSKSNSMDSMSWMQTPSITPCSSRGATSSVQSRPGLLSAAGTDKKETVVKNLKPPPYHDKKTVNDIFMNIHEFLERHEYQFERQIKSATMMTNSEYHLMTRFTIQLWMGKHIFSDVKNDDLPKRFLEISVQLKYPGTLNKAILASPNVPHQLPAALTFLAWLTCMTERSLTPLNDKRNLTELVAPEKYVLDLAKDACLNLFFQDISGPIEPLAVEEELQRYQRNVMEVYGFGESPTKDELIRIRDEKREELHLKDQLPDPRKELLLIIQDNNKRIRANEEKEKEMLELLEKIADVDKIKARAAALNEKLTTVEGILDSLTRQVSKQELSKLEESQLMTEMEDFMKQRDTVEQVNSAMLLQQQKREQHLSNLNARFFDTCTRLSVCDIFNDLLQRLELLRMLADMERIPKNPFTPAGMKDWLKAVLKIRKTTQIVLAKLEVLVTKRFEAGTTLNAELEQAEADSLLVEEEMELEVENTGLHHLHLLKQMDTELNVVVKEIERITEEIKEAETLKSEAYDELAALDLRLGKTFRRKYGKESQLKKWAAKAEAMSLELMELKVYCKEELAKRVCYYTYRWKEMFDNDTPDLNLDKLNLLEGECS